MSWYTDKKGWSEGAETQKETKAILRLIGSLTRVDEEILIKGLMGLNGVTEVSLNTNTNRLVVTFDPAKTEVTFIAFKVGQMGYQYVKRA